MRVLINALSIGSFSGAHVVYGFLRKLCEWTQGEHEFVVLHYPSSPPPDDISCHSHVSTVTVSDDYRSWIRRGLWESLKLPSLINSQNIDLVFNPSGAFARGLPAKQVVLAQNPWCFVPRAQVGYGQKIKAALQRRGYRRAMQSATQMVYISGFLQELYRASSGSLRENASEIAYVGIDDETFEAAGQLSATVAKVPNLIVSVSAMAHWKGAETLVESVSILQQRNRDVQLRMVGPWPDSAYERNIRQLIDQHGLNQSVEITGAVSKAELHHNYAEAKVFALISWCESYGIPAVEAQAFGTPGLVSTGCAMPEICGEGCETCPPGEPQQAADVLERLLFDDENWQRRSRAARDNASRLTWEKTTRPLMSMFTL